MSLFSPPGARRSVSRPPSDPLPPCDAPPARLSLRPLSPWGAAAAMASPSDSIIILDGDDDEDDGAPQPSPPPPPAAAAAAAEKAAEPPGPSGGAPPQLAQARGGAGHRAPALGKDPASLRVENERLFAEFIAFCSQHTADHQEVMPYLAARHQKASPDYLDSVEFRNVLGRCLTRVQARPSKVYVYINELCTVFRAHAQKKLQAAPDPSGSGPSAPCEPREGSKRQIRYLENLLRVCAGEIRKLQERELDLEELDNEDSAYMQESRLKRRMMRIFERLCQLKDCNSLTGRVIEQRIPYRGTRYPEVNRRIERLINHDPEAFPDYADILKVVQKASTRHSLNLPKRQMESMAADAFREVGNRLQERRHLDLIYNFGNHLTDQYRPNSDPALADGELARRLRQNRDMALRRLEQVTSQFAQLQDRSEEEEWLQRRRRGGRAQAGSSSAAGCQQGELSSPKEGSQSPKGVSKEAEWGEEEEEEEEEEESSSESDMEAELEKSLEDREDAEGVVPAAALKCPALGRPRRKTTRCSSACLPSKARPLWQTPRAPTPPGWGWSPVPRAAPSNSIRGYSLPRPAWQPSVTQRRSSFCRTQISPLPAATLLQVLRRRRRDARTDGAGPVSLSLDGGSSVSGGFLMVHGGVGVQCLYSGCHGGGVGGCICALSF
ncbi:death domain-associated protein 6 isoform X5 [Rhineura floridana]|uniref:death domain-associated protein 6 isoform X5 n=1 Tax=Rhineura floridana TaxID=261503 RepID=UPI002AC7E7D6|nr:death domain-associated protein 6 isoform X5 [Rhineura floridana]